MKKLAICTPGFKPVPALEGGAVEQLTTYIVMENEKTQNYDIDLYTCSNDRLDNISLKNTHIIQIEDKQKNIFWRVLFALINRSYRLFKIQEKKTYIEQAIARACLKKKYDMVLVENNMNIFNRIAIGDKDVDMYFHLHNNIDCGDIGKTREKACRVVERARTVIAASDFVKQRLEEVTGAGNVVTVHNCLDEKLFNKAILKYEGDKIREQYVITNKTIMVLFIGRMDCTKGALELIEAINLLPESINIKCIVVGNNWFGSKEESEYQVRIKSLAQVWPQRYCFVEYINYDQIPKLYSGADIVVIPSRCEEVFGMVALEAMYMGKPVIASKRGALPEVLNEKCAVFIDENNFVQSLALQLEKLSADEDRRYRMGQAGRERAQTKFYGVDEYYNRINKILAQTT